MTHKYRLVKSGVTQEKLHTIPRKVTHDPKNFTDDFVCNVTHDSQDPLHTSLPNFVCNVTHDLRSRGVGHSTRFPLFEDLF